MKFEIKQHLSKQKLSDIQYDQALLYCNERYKEGNTLEEIHDVLTTKSHMNPLVSLSKNWFSKLLAECNTKKV